MPSDREIFALIDQLKSDDSNERQTAQKELVAAGRSAVFRVVGSFNKGVSTNVIIEILKAMPPELATSAYKVIVNAPKNITMPPDMVQVARDGLQAVDINPDGPKPPKYNVQCEDFDITIDASWNQCKLGLEHPGAKDYPCYWLSSSIQFASDDSKPTFIHGGATSQEAVADFINQLKAEGFSQDKKSVMREWEYITFAR